MRLKTRRILRAAALAAALLLLAVSAWALPPAGWSVAVGGGTTSNLFRDSLGLGDEFARLSGGVDQPLLRSLLAYYEGQGEAYAEYGGLSSFEHTAGLEAGTFLGERAEAWAAAEGVLHAYGEQYELYDRRGLYFGGGLRWVVSPLLRTRLRAGYSTTRYPNAGSLSVGTDDLTAALGVNLATRASVALDAEAGFESRLYPDLQPETRAEAVWAVLRLSAPLGQRTGGAVRLTVREQLTVGSEGLTALYEGGIDPGNLLWDGWRIGAELNHRAGESGFELSLRGEAGLERFVEVQALTGRPGREDRAVRARVTLSRTFTPGGSAGPALSLWLSLHASAVSSTDSYYNANTTAATVTLSVLSP
jgi:hypothetical protein